MVDCIYLSQLFYRESGSEGETSLGGVVVNFNTAEEKELEGGDVLKELPSRPKVLRLESFYIILSFPPSDGS